MEAVRLDKKEKNGAENYTDEVLKNTDLITLKKNGKNVGKRYVTEQPAGIFTDYIWKVFKEALASDLAKAHYYCVLSDVSMESTLIEHELVYILFMLEGTPQCKFLSNESGEIANSERIRKCINKAFQHIGITNFSKKVTWFKCW